MRKWALILADDNQYKVISTDVYDPLTDTFIDSSDDMQELMTRKEELEISYVEMMKDEL